VSASKRSRPPVKKLTIEPDNYLGEEDDENHSGDEIGRADPDYQLTEEERKEIKEHGRMQTWQKNLSADEKKRIELASKGQLPVMNSGFKPTASMDASGDMTNPVHTRPLTVDVNSTHEEESKEAATHDKSSSSDDDDEALSNTEIVQRGGQV